MTRWKAFAIHLGISALVGTVVVATMLALWYPGPFFTAMGGNDVLLALIGVYLGAGPLITLIVFNPGKRLALLRLDLAVIGTIQVLAIAYTVSVIAKSRPAYMVFTVDRFDLVAANDIKDAELARVKDARFRSVPWGRPPTVAVKSPTDPKEQMRIIQSALEGADLQTFPQYYVDYESLAAQALKASKPYAVLRRRHPESLALLDRRLAELGRREEEVRFLPLKARKTDYCVLIDARNGAVLGFLELYPW